MLNIVLLYHSTKNDNLGVGALSVSEIEIIRKIAHTHDIPLHITVIDGCNPRPPYVSGSDITVREMRPLRQPLSVFRAFRESDLVVDIGGGDSFSDIYGWQRFGRMLLQKYMVHLAGRPLVLAPQTIGPFKSRFMQAIAALSIRWSAVISTRDAMSTQALRQMGIRKPVIEASDVALRLPFTPALQQRSDRPVRIGLNVSGLLMQGGYTRDNMFGLRIDYRKLMGDIIASFLSHPDDCEVHLVPHVISWKRGAVEDDYQASLDLASEFPQVKVAPAFATPSEAKSYISEFDFFMGARMHACIAAFSSGVPVVPIAYSRKFAGLFGSLGYDYTVDCTTETEAQILERIMESYERRTELREETINAFELGLKKLGAYEDALSKLMVQIAATKAR